MLDIVNHQENVNQNQEEISSHTCQNDCVFFFLKTLKCWQGCGEIDTFCVLIHIRCINYINKAMQSRGYISGLSLSCVQVQSLTWELRSHEPQHSQKQTNNNTKTMTKKSV